MNRTVYKLKNAEGLYFNGITSPKRFTKVGKCYETIKDLQLDVGMMFAWRLKHEKFAKLLDGTEIVKEVQTIAENQPEENVDVFIGRMNEKHRVLNAIRNSRTPAALSVVYELDQTFPIWDIGDFKYVVYVDTYRIRPNSTTVIRELAKTIGAKRTQCVKGERIIAFKEMKFVTAAKLVVGNLMEFHDLSKV